MKSEKRVEARPKFTRNQVTCQILGIAFVLQLSNACAFQVAYAEHIRPSILIRFVHLLSMC